MGDLLFGSSRGSGNTRVGHSNKRTCGSTASPLKPRSCDETTWMISRRSKGSYIPGSPSKSPQTWTHFSEFNNTFQKQEPKKDYSGRRSIVGISVLSVLQPGPCRLIPYPFSGYTVFGLGSCAHKVGYPEKGVNMI